jgi:CheY-like chemotaxis protein
MAGQILLVDDDNDMRKALAVILRDCGYEVTEADDGYKAATLIREGMRPDLILLDLMMPVMDGREFIRTLRNGSTKIPIVVITAFSEKDAIEGTVATIHKPFNLTKILEAAERYCGPPEGPLG